MSEMVERVARAIAEARFGIGCPVDDDDRIAARAAIEAMREPTEAMARVAVDDILSWPGIGAFLNWNDLAASRYRLMIDAAIRKGD